MIKLNNIHKIYNAGKPNELEALKGVSLEIKDGELVAIIDKSGAGKSTLLHTLACIDGFDEGEYYIDEQKIQYLSEKEYAKIRNEKIGIVMQDFALIDDFTVLENVMLPLDFASKKKANPKQSATEALQSVAMETMLHSYASKLSGGQKQRVAIARAIVNEPGILLADEPTGALDSKTASEIMDVFKALNAKGKTVIIVTHDPGIAGQCRRIIEIADGVIVSDQTNE